MGIKNFWELEAWKKGHSVVLAIYTFTEHFPKNEQFGLVSQMRRAAASVTANLAEGFERYHFKDKNRFYYQSRGSAAEVQNFILLARDLLFIDHKTSEYLMSELADVMKLINGLIRKTSSYANH